MTKSLTNIMLDTATVVAFMLGESTDSKIVKDILQGKRKLTVDITVYND